MLSELNLDSIESAKDFVDCLDQLSKTAYSYDELYESMETECLVKIL